MSIKLRQFREALETERRFRRLSPDELDRQLGAWRATQASSAFADALSEKDLAGAARSLFSGEAVPDLTGVPPSLVHDLRQEVHRSSGSGRSPNTAGTNFADIDRLVEEGIVHMPNLVDADTLDVLKQQMDDFVDRLDRGLADGDALFRQYDQAEHFSPRFQAYTSNDALSWSGELCRLAVRSDLIERAEDYLGGTPLVQRVEAMRYLPGASPEERQFRWHHDHEDRRLKVMVLLSDVEPDGQPMRFLRRSHTARRDVRSFISEPVEGPEADGDDDEVFMATGSAGDAFLFDTNGAHTATRRADAPLRDIVTISYSVSPSQVFGGDPAPEFLTELDAGSRVHLDPMVSSVSAWHRPEQRRNTVWIETLNDVTGWRSDLGLGLELGPEASERVG